MNNNLNCPKCNKTFTKLNPPKQLINCQHILCLKCLKSQIICPIDRKRIQRPKYTQQAFKTNQNILQQCISNQLPKSTNSNRQNKESSNRKNSSNKNNKNISNSKIKNENDNQTQDGSPVRYSIKIQSQIKNNLNSHLFGESTSKNTLQYQMCLLHMKRAQLVCMQDRQLICSNCALFGDHRLHVHNVQSLQKFILNFNKMNQQGIRVIKQLEQRGIMLSNQTIHNQISRIISQKKKQQTDKIKKEFKKITDMMNKIQKQTILHLEQGLKIKQKKLKQQLQFNQFWKQKQELTQQMNKMSEQYNNIFNFDIQSCLQYFDRNNPKSQLIKEGQYLIMMAQKLIKQSKQKMQKNINQIKIVFENNPENKIRQIFSFTTKDMPQILKIIQITKKNPYSTRNNYSSNNQKQILQSINQKQNINSNQSPSKKQQLLLIGSNSKTKSNIKKDISAAKIQKLNQISLFNIQEQAFNQIQIKPQTVYRVNNKINNFQQDIRCKSKSRSKKSKKLQLPEKYMKTFDDLIKDALQVCDFGNALMGDSSILQLIKHFQNKNKLKTVKLMNNNISDQIFSQIVWHCRGITSLNLSGNTLTEKSLQWLQYNYKNLGKLSTITLSNNKIVLRKVKQRLDILKMKGLMVSL